MYSVDVVVPCYRYGHYLRECVESVLAQSDVKVRVLIIDDASPDVTAAVATDLAKDDTRVTFVRHSHNKGHIRTYNEGIDWAASDYFLLLSADDYLLPGALGRAARLMGTREDVGLVFGRALELDDSGSTKEIDVVYRILGGRDQLILRGAEFIEASGPRNIVPTPTAIVRTTLQKAIGGYRTDLPHAGDMEMWLRFAARASVALIGQHQAVYRRHANNMSSDYVVDHWLPDLRQRKAALDVFFGASADLELEAPMLRENLLKALGHDAIRSASTAFSAGNLALSDELTRFALECSSRVRPSAAWTSLAVKRALGLRRWRALSPIISKVWPRVRRGTDGSAVPLNAEHRSR